MILKINEQFYNYVHNKLGEIILVLINPSLKEVIDDKELISWCKYKEVKGLINRDNDNIYIFDSKFLHRDLKDCLKIKDHVPLILNEHKILVSNSLKIDKKKELEFYKEIILNNYNLKKMYCNHNFENIQIGFFRE